MANPSYARGRALAPFPPGAWSIKQRGGSPTKGTRMTNQLITPPPAQRPRRPAVLSVANQLTASRLLLSVVLFALIAMELWLWGLGVFGVAALTDWLDGYFARVRGQASA